MAYSLTDRDPLYPHSAQFVKLHLNAESKNSSYETPHGILTKRAYPALRGILSYAPAHLGSLGAARRHQAEHSLWRSTVSHHLLNMSHCGAKRKQRSISDRTILPPILVPFNKMFETQTVPPSPFRTHSDATLPLERFGSSLCTFALISCREGQSGRKAMRGWRRSKGYATINKGRLYNAIRATS